MNFGLNKKLVRLTDNGVLIISNKEGTSKYTIGEATPTIEELREWSAGLMGYILHTQENKFQVYMVPGGLPDGRKGFDKREWIPDQDLNQAFLIVERMRELGWALHFSGRVENKDYGVGFAREYSVNQNLNLYKTAPGHAILLAAHATGEGQGIPDPEEK